MQHRRSRGAGSMFRAKPRVGSRELQSARDFILSDAADALTMGAPREVPAPKKAADRPS
jgi:hypothetical protein